MRKKSKEDESFLEAKERKRKGQRGKSAEALVEDSLNEIAAATPEFTAERLPDTRSAGGRAVLPPQTCDFNVWSHGQSFSLEIKEVAEGTRLKKFVQLPRMQRRAMAGCQGIVLVHFLEKDLWAMAWTKDLELGAASWDLEKMLGVSWWKTAKDALTFLWGKQA